MVAVMTDLLELKPDDVLLEIGTGLGYQAAVLAELAGRVYSVEKRARMFAVLSTAWVVPGVIGPALADRISSWIS